MSLPASATGTLEGLLARVVEVEPGETRALLWSFAFFFSVLCSYYILRPLRDEMGVTIGKEGLQVLFTAIFVVMLAAVPVFGWIVSNVPRARIVPLVYAFLVANLLIFRFLMIGGPPGPTIAGIFYVWINVYVMFVVSLFWSCMSDVWATGQAKRLYGFISVGGTAGALAGPLLVQALLSLFGLANMPLLAALFLALAGLASIILRRQPQTMPGGALPAGPKEKSSLIAGALNVWRSPFLFRIALWVLIANVVGMFFYLEQLHIVGETLKDQTERVVLFSRIETAVSLLTILAQLFLTPRLIGRIGVGSTAAILPAAGLLGLVALSIAPVLGVIVAIVVLQRAIGYGVANPAMRVLYTVVAPEDKYRAQNFVDTVVYRGADAGAGWAFGTLSKQLGIGVSAIAMIVLPLGALWAGLSLALGRRHEVLAKAAQIPTAKAP